MLYLSSDEAKGNAPRAKSYYPVVLRAPVPNNYHEPAQQPTYDVADTTALPPRAKVHGYVNIPQTVTPGDYGNLSYHRNEANKQTVENVDDANMAGFGFGFEPVIYTNINSDSADI